MPLIALMVAFVVLILLMTRWKVNAFISLIIAAVIVGILRNMDLAMVVKSINAGITETLGSLVLILTFGAMLGKILQTTGAAYQITTTIVDGFGRKRINIAIIVAGFIIGIPMMYNASFLVLIPIIYTFSNYSKIPLLQLGIPLSAALSVAHGYLPPHPAPVAVSETYGANMNLVFVYGLIFSIPAVLVAGIWLPRFFRSVDTALPKFFSAPVEVQNPPSFWISMLCATSPFILMVLTVVVPGEHPMLDTIGTPAVSLFLAVLIAIFFLGLMRGTPMKLMMDALVDAAASISMILLIIAAGGAFKQVLLDSGSCTYIQQHVGRLHLHPLVLSWCLAATIRLLIGSATVATITAAGIMLPILSETTVSRELLVISTGAGSLMFSHFNDIGFWMFKEYYNVSIKQTFQIWTVMECLVGIIGLLGCLVIQMFFFS